MALVMGVINVTPDSFSDAGQCLDHEAAIARGHALIVDGADYTFESGPQKAHLL